MMNSFGWLDETDLDLTLDDYHIAVAETALPKKQPSSVQPSYHRHTSSGFGFISTFRASMDRKPSTRRPLEDWGSGWAPAQRPSLPRSISATETPKVRSHSVSQAPASPPSLPRASTQTDIGPVHLRQSSSMARASVESGATHYLNPEARLKLRYYLASPSKFDEALEFGFPSLQQPSTRRNSMSSSRRRSNSISSRAKHSKSTSNVSNTQGLTFLDDETTVPSINLSATEQRLDLDPSVSRLSSSDSDATDRNPITPQAPSFLSSPSAQTQMGQPQGWIDTELVKKDQHSEAQRDPYLQDSWGGREMTLRMTLTRPDLRADDSVLYPDAATHPQALRMSNSQRGRMGKGFGSMDRDTSKLDDFFFGDEKPIASKEMSGVRRFLSRKW